MFGSLYFFWLFVVYCIIYKLNYIVKVFGSKVWKFVLQHSVGVLT